MTNTHRNRQRRTVAACRLDCGHFAPHPAAGMTASQVFHSFGKGYPLMTTCPKGCGLREVAK